MTTRIIRHTHTPVTNEALSLRDMMNRLMENAFVSPEQWSGDWSQFQGAARLEARKCGHYLRGWHRHVEGRSVC
jgi:hypothetical protein